MEKCIILVPGIQRVINIVVNKMGKVIPLVYSEEYTFHLKKIKEILTEASDDLFLQAVNLCANSVWEEWTNNRKEGERFEFDTDMLKESGDYNARSVALIMEMLKEAADELDEII